MSSPLWSNESAYLALFSGQLFTVLNINTSGTAVFALEMNFSNDSEQSAPSEKLLQDPSQHRSP